MLDIVTHKYYSLIDPPNKEEILINVENSKLSEEQDFSWVDGCFIQVERLDLGEKFIPLFKPSLDIFLSLIHI